MIDIVVVNWNAGSQLAEAIVSIVHYHSNLVSSVIIVDNASTDNSLDEVEALRNFPFSLQVIRNTINRGFGAACNQGAALHSSEYLLFLNPDARLFDHSLSVPFSFMNLVNNANVGIVGIQLINELGHIARSCSRFPSALGYVARTTGLDRIYPRLGHFMAEWDHLKTRQVDQVIGAFFFVRRQLFNTSGGFDERFFVYMEEVDFSLRAKRLGWSSMYLADAQAFHAGGGTSNQIKARRLFYSLRSRLLYVFKHFNVLGAIVVFLATLLIEPLSRSALALVQRSIPALRETWAAYGMLWRWLPLWVFRGQVR